MMLGMTDQHQLSSPAWWDARYREGATGWDHGIVVPEVEAFAAGRPGDGAWALDIGCGTGTHGRELARRGYRVVAIDLSHVAVRRALSFAQAENLTWFGVQGSAAHLDLFRQTFALALDVGCFHGLTEEQQRNYALGLHRRLAPGGYYLLYAVHPRTSAEQWGPPGVAPARIEQIFSPYFTPIWRREGRQGERRADWHLWQAQPQASRS